MDWTLHLIFDPSIDRSGCEIFVDTNIWYTPPSPRVSFYKYLVHFLRRPLISGSKSSKCTKIKTPVDSHKIWFIDNKLCWFFCYLWIEFCAGQPGSWFRCICWTWSLKSKDVLRNGLNTSTNFIFSKKVLWGRPLGKVVYHIFGGCCLEL